LLLYSWEPGELRRRRRTRNPVAQASTKAAATRAGGSIAEIGLLCPANPTRITPELVTAGAWLVPVGPGPPMLLADGEDALGVGRVLPVGAPEPPMLPAPPVRVGTLDVGGGDDARLGGAMAGVLRDGWVVAGAVVGFATPPAVTTMSTEGLPAPHSAVTV
jgi:hypothetical protein